MSVFREREFNAAKTRGCGGHGWTAEGPVSWGSERWASHTQTRASWRVGSPLLSQIKILDQINPPSVIITILWVVI